MKKIWSVFLIFSLLLSLCACQSTDGKMEEHYVCNFRVYLYGDYPDYTLEDFGDLGLEKLESHPNPAAYNLYGTFKNRKKIQKAYKALVQMDQVKNVTLECKMFRVPKGTDSYPSLERPFTYDPVQKGDVYDGRIEVAFDFDDFSYNHLISLEDFKDLPVEACVLNYWEDEVYGYVNLYEYGEEPLQQAIQRINEMPYVSSVQVYFNGRAEIDLD